MRAAGRVDDEVLAQGPTKINPPTDQVGSVINRLTSHPTGYRGTGVPAAPPGAPTRGDPNQRLIQALDRGRGFSGDALHPESLS